jgi:catechol 2,3-dioxygenase
MRNGPRKHLVSQLAHVELLTPRLPESIEFFTELLGLSLVEKTDRSAYLRCWGEFQHHSLKLTEAPQPGLGHAAWRADSAEALERAAAEIEATGRGQGWIDGDRGHGRAYQFMDPDDHLGEIFWEVDRFRASGADAPTLKTRSTRMPMNAAAVRRLDHVTFGCSTVEPSSAFYTETLGFLQTELARFDGSDELLISTLTTNCRDHDLNLVRDWYGARGRLTHLAFWNDTREAINHFADLATEYAIELKFGPSRHRGTELYFLYVTEPGGNMIELCTGGYFVFEPDWEVVEWSTSDNQAVMWATEFPESFYKFGTPPVSEPATSSD